MKVSLEALDARGITMDLPGAARESVTIASASGLRGTLEQSDDRLALSGVAAEGVVIDALRLVFGSLILSTEAAVAMSDVALALEQTARSLAVDLGSGSLTAAGLTVEVDDVTVRGRVTLAKARLVLRGDDGTLSAERVELSGFVVRAGDLELQADALEGSSVEIGWGAAGFRLRAASIEGPTLRVAASDVRVDARGVALKELALVDGRISLESARFEGAQTAVAISTGGGAARGERRPRATSAEPLFDWGVLDALSGEIAVDAAVDLTVPILGRRKATHRLRVPIVGGAIDFRALEDNLATLEDALLDFSVREGAIVLERVNPLFPKRGYGKPIVVWDVEGADHELARQDRVRLAVLPRARLAEGDGASSPSDEPGSVALLELALLRIDARLALGSVESPLAPPSIGQLRPRHVKSLRLGGDVFHSPGAEPREGSLAGELDTLAIAIAGLTVGTSRLDVTSLCLGAIVPIEVAFAGASPKQIQVGLARLHLDEVVLHTTTASRA